MFKVGDKVKINFTDSGQADCPFEHFTAQAGLPFIELNQWLHKNKGIIGTVLQADVTVDEDDETEIVDASFVVTVWHPKYGILQCYLNINELERV